MTIRHDSASPKTFSISTYWNMICNLATNLCHYIIEHEMNYLHNLFQRCYYFTAYVFRSDIFSHCVPYIFSDTNRLFRYYLSGSLWPYTTILTLVWKENERDTTNVFEESQEKSDNVIGCLCAERERER